MYLQDSLNDYVARSTYYRACGCAIICTMIELAMPSGNLECALIELSNGADSVYFGLKDFSARKGAENFSIEDLRKIRNYSKRCGKKIYITFNTLIDDENLEKAYSLLAEIEKYNIDGLIVQDLGIARIVRKEFPSIPLHGSTQMAVHTSSGVRTLECLGFQRTVLSRELSFEEIKKIRAECPDADLKVFIHGAMCYGFSGLCMASYMKTGRSANGGACAQICRTWFEDEEKNRFFPFSMKDLDIGEKIKELDQIGINSAKVEGRMKGYEYAKYVTLYYRSILDGKETDDRHLFTFSREHSDGYWNYCKSDHENLICEKYTGHIGKKAIIVRNKKGNTYGCTFLIPVKNRDGLMVIRNNKGIPFSASIKDELLITPREIVLEEGETVYKISDSSMNTPLLSEEIPLEKERRDVRVILEKDVIRLSADNYEKSYPITVLEGKSQKGLDEIVKILSESPEDIALKVKRIENKSGYEDVFVRGKDIKRIRRDFIAGIPAKEAKKYKPDLEDRTTELLPDRRLLDSDGFPWNLEGNVIGNKRYIILPPILFEEDEILRKAELYAERSKEEVIIGLNNIAELEWAKGHREYKYFADIYLYLSNREAARLLKDELGNNLIGGYLWLERKDYIRPWPFTPTPAYDYIPPLFISRSCFRHDSKGLACASCKGKSEYKLYQNGKEYIARVKDCMTVVMENEI